MQSGGSGVARKLVAIGVFAFVGILLSVYLTYHFYQVRSGMGSFHSFCHVNEKLNCDLVTASPFAEVFAGLPLSSFAGGWYLGLLLMMFVAFSTEWRREAVRAIFGMSVVGAFCSVMYFIVMALVLNTFCLLCLGIDAVNLILLVLAISLKPEWPKSRSDIQFSQWRGIAGGVLGAVLIAVVLLTSLDKVPLKTAELQELAQNVLQSPVVQVPAEGSVLTMGPATAPIRIIEFSDYQCPYCRFAAQLLNVVKNRYPNQVRIEFWNFPLDQSCNPEMKAPAHTASCEAAKVALCAHEQGRFETVYETLFEKQMSLRPGVPTQLAKELGVDENKLDQCVRSPATAATILRDIQVGMKLNISATPTLYVNGHKMEGPYPVGVWIRIIDELLKNGGSNAVNR